MNKMIPNECSLLRMTSTFHQKPSVQSKPEFRGRGLDDGCQGLRGWPVIKVIAVKYTGVWISVQCLPINRITLGQHKSDNNKRMIQLTDVFCVLSRDDGTSNI